MGPHTSSNLRSSTLPHSETQRPSPTRPTLPSRLPGPAPTAMTTEELPDCLRLRLVTLLSPRCRSVSNDPLPRPRNNSLPDRPLRQTTEPTCLLPNALPQVDLSPARAPTRPPKRLPNLKVSRCTPRLARNPRPRRQPLRKTLLLLLSRRAPVQNPNLALPLLPNPNRTRSPPRRRKTRLPLQWPLRSTRPIPHQRRSS